MEKKKSGSCERIAEIKIKGRTVFVAERESDSNGSFTYTDKNGKVLMLIGKSLGGAADQSRNSGKPVFPSPSRELTSYDRKIINSKTDILGKSVLAQKEDPSYEGVLDLLPPLGFPYTFLGDREYPCRPSPRIDWDGSIRGFLGFGLNGRPLGWMQGDQNNVKYGLLDGYLPAVQFVYVNEKDKIGWEEIATARACPEADNSLLVFLRFKVKNLSDKPRKENMSVFFSRFSQVSMTDSETFDDIPAPSFYPTFNGPAVEQPEYLWVSEENDYKKGKVYPFCNINRPCQLRGGEEKSLYLVLAYTRPLKRGMFQRMVPGLNFYRALFETKKDWDGFLEKGMRVETPEPRVNNASKAALIQGFMSVAGSDVRYAVAGRYANEHALTSLDGLPIAIINASECFSEWGQLKEVRRYLDYYLKHYINPDGSASYRNGTGGYDYGLLLYSICRYYRLNNKDSAWVIKNILPIKNICNFIMGKRNEGVKQHPAGSPLHGLIGMISCDDLRHLGDRFYNYANDACCWLGLLETGRMLVEAGAKEPDKTMLADGKKILKFAEEYRKDIVVSLKKSINRDSKPVFVPIYPGNNKPFTKLTAPGQDGLASFANFGFYPFLLYSNLLDKDVASAVVEFREKKGGEILGTSRFGSGQPRFGNGPPYASRMDDWPIALHGWALINLDMVKKFLLTYYSDMAHHRMKDIFTAYEQVGIVDVGGGRKITAGYNICSTLATPRMTKYMLVFEERDKDLIWLNRAAPRAWLEDGKKTLVKNAPTRWGKIGYSVESHISRNNISARIDFSGPPCGQLEINLRLRHPGHKKLGCVRVNGREWRRVDRDNDIISVPCAKRGQINIETYYDRSKAVLNHS